MSLRLDELCAASYAELRQKVLLNRLAAPRRNPAFLPAAASSPREATTCMTTHTRPARAGDQSYLKRLNRSAILELVRQEPGLSRAELAARTHVTKVTVGTVVQELLDEGWLTEGTLQHGGLGRPGRPVHLNEDRHVIIGADVGVQGLRVVATTLTGRVLTRHVHDGPTGDPDTAAATLAALITAAQNDPAARDRQLLGLGVAVPGPVSQPGHLLLLAPNLGWRDVPFLDLLSAHLPALPGLTLLENEANAAAFAESYLRGRDAPDMLAYLSLGSGIGAGLVVGAPEPRLLRGAGHLAGEIGHTVLQPGGLYCHCGNRGCAETLLSGWAIRAALGIPHGPLVEAVNARLDEPEVQVTLRRAGEALGLLLTNLNHTLNPSEIVLGGPLTRLGGPLMPAALDFFHEHQHHLYATAPPTRVQVRTDSTLLAARGVAAQVLARTIRSAESGVVA
ncbi:ROK family protein [Deinococcus knuensis]|nr:ROK family protein [Deinococcus knuensis]